MNTNEITYNELSAGDLLIEYGFIDLINYADYLEDEEACFKLVVWDLQCKYSQRVLKYTKHLKFGLPCKGLLDNLIKFKRGLEVLNRYNPRDIEDNTTDYNTISYDLIKKVIQKLYSL